MSDILRFDAHGRSYALVMRCPPPGTVAFFTPPECALQAGVLDRPGGHVVAAHGHAPVAAPSVRGFGEFLFVASGRVRIEVFDEQWASLGVCTLESGDSVVFCAGGHRVEMLEATRLVEVKQGPYAGDADSKCFPPLPVPG